MECVVCNATSDQSGLCEKHKYDEQLRSERRERVTNWIMAQIAAADDSLILTRTDRGKISIDLPNGASFTLTVSEVD